MAATNSTIDTTEPSVSPNPKGIAELWAFAQRVLAEFKQHYVPVKAAGLAFFAFLALVPTLVAVVSIYGLVADPDEIGDQILEATESLDESVSNMLAEQMTNITQNSGGAIGGVVVGILLALFTASAAVKHLISTLNVIYEFPETRNPIRLRLLAYGLTLAGTVLFALVVFALGALPTVLGSVGIGALGRWLLSVGTYPVMILIMSVALAVLYRVAPNRKGGRFRWSTAGSMAATLLWVLASLAFSIYVANAGNLNETYGVFASIAILLLWMYLTALSILLGAEVDATRIKLRAEAEAERNRRTNPPALIVDGERTQAGKAALVGVLVGAAIGGITGSR